MERKLATVLFVDLVGSTALVAGADPEVVRRRVTRFFDAVSACVVGHGGLVEKFAGDAVMAAFGVPLAHEDDAERAVRAALAIFEKLHDLGLQARAGIESGEVVADDSDSTFATGEAVNVAARLQQSASPGEILVGPGVERLTRGRIETEPVGSLELRGFREAFPVWRVEAACEGGRPLGSLTAPLVGRDEELELLENTFNRISRHRRAALFTLYGEPGVGKSRLAREFVAGLEGATVLFGRSLPYGEGVTYWPLAEMVKASVGITDDEPSEEARQKLRDYCEAEEVADLLALAAGVLEAVEGERSPQEISWAARAWAEQLAEAQPLVLVFEDIQWAEEPLLDLVEHLAAWVKDAPLMLLCLARPELLDVRPTWGGGRVRATAVELEPLPAEDSRELVEALVAEREAPIDLRAVLEKTEGNPLFVEETIRMLLEDGRGTTQTIPDTLQALIAARIDRLPHAQRTVLQRASVIGRIFWPGAITQLSHDIEDAELALEQLLLRDFVVRESRSSISGEVAYKFKHVLIREVAYSGLTKAARAEYHALFALWLEEHAGEELLEIRAFHLDQAARLHAELEGSVPAELASDTAAALTAAGKRALSRESFRTARRLLLRALELEPTLQRRFDAARAAWRMTDLPAVLVEMAAVAAEAEAAGAKQLRGRALAALAEATLWHGADAVGARRLVEEALEALRDEPPVVRFEGLRVAYEVASWVGDTDEYERFAEEALAAAREADRKDLETLVIHSLVMAYTFRFELAKAGVLVVRALELADASGSALSRAAALSTRGWLHLASERFAEAEADYEAARELYAELGNTSRESSMQMMSGRAAFAQGDVERAEKRLREAERALKGLGDRGALCEAQRSLAMVLAVRGSLDEAERYALQARETVGPDDRVSVSTTALGLAFVRAAQGRDAEAEELYLDAIDGFAQYDLRSLEHWALRLYADFLRDRGRDEDAEVYEVRRAELNARSTAPIV